MIRFRAVAFLCAAFKTSADPRAGHRQAQFFHLLRIMETGADRVARSGRYIAGRLICAVDVNAALAERGIKGKGSALAMSFLGWGHASAPVLGAVAVSSRGRHGGHSAIVSRVEGEQVLSAILAHAAAAGARWHTGIAQSASGFRDEYRRGSTPLRPLDQCEPIVPGRSDDAPAPELTP